MRIDLANHEQVVQRFVEIEPLELGDHPPPWGAGTPTAAQVTEVIDGAIDDLPLAYRQAYAEPLRGVVEHLLRSDDDPRVVALNVETLAGAVFQHGPQSAVRGQLRQFLAVVSNYFRSFLAAGKRRAVLFPLPADGIPPLATFRHSGRLGPFTFPADVVRRLCGASIAVVSLPQRLRNHPVTWLTLAHETVGHDVLHADPELLPELAAAVRTVFGGGPLTPGRPPDRDQLQSLLWSYWIEEVASDVYALLNSGPAFAYNLAAFLEALPLDTGLVRPTPFLPLAAHPPGMLRMHVAIGVVRNLAGLAPEDRDEHVENLGALARRQWESESVEVQGRVEVDRDRWVDLGRTAIPLADLADAARRVGGFVATASLRTFGGHSVQEIETWDADDERVALLIADALAAAEGDPQRVMHLGDDAQLLAGATLAVLREPARYEAINFALAGALDESFRRDEVVGRALFHPLFDLEPPAFPGPDAEPGLGPGAGPQRAGVGGPPTPAPQDDVAEGSPGGDTR